MPWVRNPKHVFVFFQQTREQNALAQNPYIFDTFDLDGPDSAKLFTCRPQYSNEYYLNTPANSKQESSTT